MVAPFIKHLGTGAGPNKIIRDIKIHNKGQADKGAVAFVYSKNRKQCNDDALHKSVHRPLSWLRPLMVLTSPTIRYYSQELLLLQRNIHFLIDGWYGIFKHQHRKSKYSEIVSSWSVGFNLNLTLTMHPLPDTRVSHPWKGLWSRMPNRSITEMGRVGLDLLTDDFLPATTFTGIGLYKEFC